MMQLTAQDVARAELESIVGRRLADPDPGARPVLRAIDRRDAPALAEMALRCSPETLRHRFHAPVQHLDPARLIDLLSGVGDVRTEDTVVADVDGAIVGIATVHVPLGMASA